MPDKNKLKEIYEKLATPEERLLERLEEIDLAKLKGDQGEPGIDGIDGKDGKDGRDGERGEKGDMGLMGLTGKDGNIITPEEVRDKLKELKDIARLSVFDLKDTEFLKGEKGMNWSSAGFKVYTDSTLTGDGSFNNPLSAVDQITVSAVAPNSPYINQLWYDIS